MRSPLFWIVGWFVVSGVVVGIWPEHRMLVSGFWIGWSMAITGQDIADYLKKRIRPLVALAIGIAAFAACGQSFAASTTDIHTITSRVPAFGIPKGTVLVSVMSTACARDVSIAAASKSCIEIELISDGTDLVALESNEGQEVLRSIVAPHAGESRW